MLAAAASNVYENPLARRLSGTHYHSHLSGPRTGVYETPTQVIVSHRGTVPTDLQDLNEDRRIMFGQMMSDTRLKPAREVAQRASQLGKPLHHVGHSLGGAVARKVSRDRGEPNTTFSRYTGFRMNPENKAATKRCKEGSSEQHCHTTTDFYNPQDIASVRIRSDYGNKKPLEHDAPRLFRNGPLATHGIQQYQGKGKSKKVHPQQKLLDLALQTVRKTK